MKIAIDAFPLTGRLAGIGRYVYEICRALEKKMPEAEFILYSPKPLSVPLPSSRWVSRVGGARYSTSYGWLRMSAGSMAMADGAQIFWATRSILPGHTDAFRTVSTVHDLNYRIYPKSMPYVTLWAHRLWLSCDVHRADAVVTNSNGTAERLRDMLGVETDAVVRPGVATVFGPQTPEVVATRLSSLGVRRPYFLAVGTVEPRKNLPALIEAFVRLKRLKELPKDYELLIAGSRGWRGQRLHALLKEAERYGVRWLGFVPDDTLAALYAGSRAFVFPSLYEGFGIPAAEARACGARVIASDLPELREAAGEDALFVQPTAEALCQALLQPILPPCPRVMPSWPEAAKVMAAEFRKLA